MLFCCVVIFMYCLVDVMLYYCNVILLFWRVVIFVYCHVDVLSYCCNVILEHPKINFVFVYHKHI
jgi:hypothetical protein